MRLVPAARYARGATASKPQASLTHIESTPSRSASCTYATASSRFRPKPTPMATRMAGHLRRDVRSNRLELAHMVQVMDEHEQQPTPASSAGQTGCGRF